MEQYQNDDDELEELYDECSCGRGKLKDDSCCSVCEDEVES